ALGEHRPEPHGVLAFERDRIGAHLAVHRGELRALAARVAHRGLSELLRALAGLRALARGSGVGGCGGRRPLAPPGAPPPPPCRLRAGPPAAMAATRPTATA